MGDMTAFRSEIRDSLIQRLDSKVNSGNYKQYLRRITLKRIRQFTDRVVTFDFPVTALVGPNGGGKTTVLGAAGLAFFDITPGTFFAKSGKYDASMKNWAIEYELVDKTLNPRLNLQRTASFRQLKWNRKAIKRPVLHFGLSRTLAATERRELVKAIGKNFVARRVVSLPDAVVDAVEKILGKDMQGCNKLSIDAQGNATIYAIQGADGVDYSEFHFGAGEASVIRLVSSIEDTPDGAMILIEELENGLHPIATRRMVEYLLEVAARKSCQVIFTTHSNDALAPLPSKAIWAAYSGEVLQGKLDIKALRTITGQIDAKLAIFVEDTFAEQMVTTALRYHGGVELDAVKIHGMGGSDPAIQVNRQHNLDPTASFPSVCILDGDQSALTDPDNRVFSLPGTTSPEAHVFDAVVQKLDRVAARLALSIQFPTDAQERVKRVVREKALTNRDRHVIFEQIGEELDFTAGMIVSNAFLAIWAQEYPDEVNQLVENFKELAPLK